MKIPSAILILSLITASFSYAAGGIVICENSPSDLVRINEQAGKVTFVSPAGEKTLTILGVDTEEHNVNHGFFGPQDEIELVRSYYVFNEDSSIVLNMDSYEGRKQTDAHIATNEKNQKVLHRYQTCK